MRLSWLFGRVTRNKVGYCCIFRNHQLMGETYFLKALEARPCGDLFRQAVRSLVSTPATLQRSRYLMPSRMHRRMSHKASTCRQPRGQPMPCLDTWSWAACSYRRTRAGGGGAGGAGGSELHPMQGCSILLSDVRQPGFPGLVKVFGASGRTPSHPSSHVQSNHVRDRVQPK